MWREILLVDIGENTVEFRCEFKRVQVDEPLSVMRFFWRDNPVF